MNIRQSMFMHKFPLKYMYTRTDFTESVAPMQSVYIHGCLSGKISGPGCSKLTMSLVNVSLKFQTLISEIC